MSKAPILKLGRTSSGLLLLLVALAATLATCGYFYWRVTRFDALILETAKEYDLDFHLVKSLIHEESWFDPDVRGHDGEIGLMQVTPRVEHEYIAAQTKAGRAKLNLFEPTDNLSVGCWYLRQSVDLFKAYRDPLPLALARYNAGESRVKVWIRSAQNSMTEPRVINEAMFLNAIDIPSTRDYVSRILRRYRTRRNSIF